MRREGGWLEVGLKLKPTSVTEWAAVLCHCPRQAGLASGRHRGTALGHQRTKEWAQWAFLRGCRNTCKSIE